MVKEKADLKEIAEAKAEVARAEIELQQARTRSVTVPAGSTVNPNEPVVVAGDHPAAWLDKIKASEASDIRMLAKRLNEDLHNMKAQIDRMAILIDGRVQAFAVDPHWRNNLKDCGSKLFDMLKDLPLAVSELGGRIATASSVHDAHTLKATEKVTPDSVSKVDQANERDDHLDAQAAKAERRKAARVKAASK